MKKILIILSILAITITSNAQTGTFYGAKFDTNNAVTISEAIQTLEKAKIASVAETKITGTIVNTCVKKGCWMNITDESGNTVRVTFKDYSFFVPTSGVENTNVTVIGTFKKETTDVASLKHFAEDAGKSADEIALITKDKTEYTFEATGVLIK
jgi:hypothetical protein